MNTKTLIWMVAGGLLVWLLVKKGSTATAAAATAPGTGTQTEQQWWTQMSSLGSQLADLTRSVDDIKNKVTATTTT